MFIPNKFSKKKLRQKILCGYCNFMCCSSKNTIDEYREEDKTLLLENYEIEKENEKTITVWCRHLSKDGCVLGDSKPIWCKLFPLTINKDNRLILSDWSNTFCPQTRDYELKKVKNKRYIYRLKKSHQNKWDIIVFEDEITNVIEEIYIQLGDSIKEFGGKDFYNKIVLEMENSEQNKINR